MSKLCSDIGWRSMNKWGEELCGDHVEIIEDELATTIVLADGLGSGVKANILSTLTATIISTMMAEGMKIEECVKTVISTLPVCAVRGVAYCTFTIIRISNREAEMIQYDNPQVILLRDGHGVDYPVTEMHIEGKTILHSRIKLQEGDVFIAMSDGCIHAGVGMELNFGWERKDIISYMEALSVTNFTAKTLNTILLDECYRLYGGQPGDDTTACTIRIRERKPVNLMMGPPNNRDDCNRMMSLFFAKEGKHIVCGGTTSSIVAQFLGSRVVSSMDFLDPKIPPIAEIEGVDLVTEGVITMSRVLEYAKDYIEDNLTYTQWSYGQDGASLIAQLLFEEATDINFFVGRAINPAHQNPNLPINFNIKMQIAEELTQCLTKMGKRVKVSYF